MPPFDPYGSRSNPSFKLPDGTLDYSRIAKSLYDNPTSQEGYEPPVVHPTSLDPPETESNTSIAGQSFPDTLYNHPTSQPNNGGATTAAAPSGGVTTGASPQSTAMQPLTQPAASPLAKKAQAKKSPAARPAQARPFPTPRNEAAGIPSWQDQPSLFGRPSGTPAPASGMLQDDPALAAKSATSRNSDTDWVDELINQVGTNTPFGQYLRSSIDSLGRIDVLDAMAYAIENPGNEDVIGFLGPLGNGFRASTPLVDWVSGVGRRANLWLRIRSSEQQSLEGASEG